MGNAPDRAMQLLHFLLDELFTISLVNWPVKNNVNPEYSLIKIAVSLYETDHLNSSLEVCLKRTTYIKKKHAVYLQDDLCTKSLQMGLPSGKPHFQTKC